MKIDYYPKDEKVAEKIRKKANVIFVLLPIEYDKDAVEDALNCEVGFDGKKGDTSIFILNEQIILLGCLGKKQQVSCEKIKDMLRLFIQMNNHVYVNHAEVLMIYLDDGLKTCHIDSIKESMNELNIIYKHEEKTKKNLYRHVFIAT